MAYDITKKRAVETAQIELKNGDGSPLLDDDGNPLFVTVNGPASKVWQQATSEQNRRRTERLRKNGGKLESAYDHAKADQIDFLCRVTVSFDGWDYPMDAKSTQQATIRAAYEDDGLGFIRDHVYSEVNDWAAFTKGSAPS